MLFSNTEQLTEFLPVENTFNFKKFSRFLREAERDFLIDTVGATLYNQVETAFQNSILETVATALTADNAKLLLKMRDAVANYAYLKHLPFAQLQIDSSGVRSQQSEKHKAAWQWQIRDLERQLSSSAFAAMEDLLSHLETTAPLAWTEADQAKEMRQRFLRSAAEFEKYVSINKSRRLYLKLLPVMAELEDRVQRITCKPLYDALKAHQQNKGTDEKFEALLQLIRPAIAHLAIARAVIELGLDLGENGVSMRLSSSSNGKEAQPADLTRRMSYKKEHQALGEEKLQALEDYLHLKADDYPLYKDSPCYKGENKIININKLENGVYFMM